MLFGRTVETYEATSVITYKLISYGDESFTIWKCDVVHDKMTSICRCIKSHEAVKLIWSDVVAGIQK